jgi:hypothetical protein
LTLRSLRIFSSCSLLPKLISLHWLPILTLHF